MDNNSVNNESKLPGGYVAISDQFGAMIQTQAGIVSGYYHKLRMDNIPDQLADQLTLQFAHFLWQKSFYGTEPEQPEQSDDPQ